MVMPKELKEKAKKTFIDVKALPLEDAFKLFPVEEEAHGGKIEYWNGVQKKK